ncbi:lytic transglycosylase domain-containing protein [Aquihabitans sp. McL0605]|uniref:lytic transglycosylase domain-containing protein n=1 Tax=Aquihabitans sp. McL0605 TaxID=3415671 RepID=UPI003CEFA34B
MPGSRRGRRTAPATALALLLGTAALVPSTRPAAAQADPPADAPIDLVAIRPIDTPGVDPVLDGVAVEATAATIRAATDLVRAASDQAKAQRALTDTGQARTEVAARRGTAVQAAEDAQQALDAATAAQAAAQQVLVERQAAERPLRTRYETRRRELRSLAASLFTAPPEDPYAILGTFADISRAERADALRDRGAAIQTRLFDQAERPWVAATRAVARQQRRVDHATAAARAAAKTASDRAAQRDHLDEDLRAAQAAVDGAQAHVDEATAASQAVLVERRRARLPARVEGLDLPLVALDAYWRAAALAPCAIPWWVLAGVGRVESRHGSAFGSKLTVDGDTTVPILGIPLDGRPGTMAVPDTDGGLLDGDATWDRAVGPMQFLPGTWGRWAVDDNADRKADPHNLYDAAGGAARYLCFGRGDLDTTAKLRGALLAYNRSNPYVADVLAKGGAYRDALDLPDVPDRPAATAGSAPGSGNGSRATDTGN